MTCTRASLYVLSVVAAAGAYKFNTDVHRSMRLFQFHSSDFNFNPNSKTSNFFFCIVFGFNELVIVCWKLRCLQCVAPLEICRLSIVCAEVKQPSQFGICTHKRTCVPLPSSSVLYLLASAILMFILVQSVHQTLITSLFLCMHRCFCEPKPKKGVLIHPDMF